MRTSELRETPVVARLGTTLGVVIAVCFTTGLICRLMENPLPYLHLPSRPVWFFRVTQGMHVTAGVAAMPLLLIKLWAVYPKFVARPIFGSVRRVLERASIGVLVGAMIFEISSGIAYMSLRTPVFPFFQPADIHYEMAWVAVGALCIHVAVKFDLIRDAFRKNVQDLSLRSAASGEGVTRRDLFAAAGLTTALAALMVVGQSVPWLRQVSLLAPRSGRGPEGIPVNGTAQASGVLETITDPNYQLEIVVRGQVHRFTRSELEALPQRTYSLPISCFEGWAANGVWTGPAVRDVLAAIGVTDLPSLLISSAQDTYVPVTLPSQSVRDHATLIALQLNGNTLSHDHGYPFRIMAPNRGGHLQTKWLRRIEVIET